jgi:DNA (cytosine-5)-methyltransferase 1
MRLETIATVSSGIGVPELAFGLRSIFQSEIAAFPSAVLAERFPESRNLGDMRNIDGESYRGQVDVFCGGTPCQAFSTIGLRRSLADGVGQLTLKFIELANEIAPTLTVWENVPGVLTTSDNAFGQFIGGMAGEGELHPPGGRWPSCGGVLGRRRAIAWKCLNSSRYVPQRRRRIYLAAIDIGRLRGLGGAASRINTARLAVLPLAILAERSLQNWDTKKGGQTQHQSPPAHGDGLIAFSSIDNGRDAGILSPTLRSGNSRKGRPCSGGNAVAITDGYNARKLTPVELERLQGLPDDYTLIPYLGGLAPNYLRVGAIANAMTLPVVRAIAANAQELITELTH